MSDDGLDDDLEEIDADALVEEIEDLPAEDVQVCHPHADEERQSWKSWLAGGSGGDRSV